MKRLIAGILILMLLPLSALAASKAKTEVKLTGNRKLTLVAGKFESFTQTFTGTWESSDPAVADVEAEANDSKKIRVIGFQPGEATLTLKGTKTKKTLTLQVTVLADETADDPLPDLIRNVIDTAIGEWQENGDVKLPDSTKTNKYLKWWRAKIGWCGAFVSYCMQQAGVPMAGREDQHKVKPLGSGEPYSIELAGVGRFHDAFINMERVTKYPRPGYLVIYGQRSQKGSSAYNFEHIGLVTDVIDRGDGTYQVFTVEGNWGKMISRFSYIYDARNLTHENISSVPQEAQTEPETYHGYKTHLYVENSDKERPFFVYEFCQTWY